MDHAEVGRRQHLGRQRLEQTFVDAGAHQIDQQHPQLPGALTHPLAAISPVNAADSRPRSDRNSLKKPRRCFERPEHGFGQAEQAAFGGVRLRGPR